MIWEKNDEERDKRTFRGSALAVKEGCKSGSWDEAGEEDLFVFCLTAGAGFLRRRSLFKDIIRLCLRSIPGPDWL